MPRCCVRPPAWPAAPAAVLLGITRVGTDGDAFAAAMGARPGLTEVTRVLDLDAIPAGHLAALRALSLIHI